jgi:glycine/D-amino acid oxidase-like deaminating enzyme
MNLSYWEYKSWLTDVDFTVVGSGIVGLNCALQLKQRFPKAKILILEKGMLPQGASTKNAGFACFGSLSEILADLNTHTEEEVCNLVQKRVDGLQLLRSTLGDSVLDYQALGGYELFSEEGSLFEECQLKMPKINRLLKPIFEAEVFSLKTHNFGFQKVRDYCGFNQFEGQIDTGKMMQALLQKVQGMGIKILNQVDVKGYSEDQNSVKIETNAFTFTSANLLIATNGFASALGISNVQPARNQVLVTKPIKDLQIKGTFHLEEGYYYFRNIDQRVLLGGGRHLDIKGETTTELNSTSLVQQALEVLLKQTILPDVEFEIQHRWSGILGVHTQKKPILKQLGLRVFCGVRLGGMGVAIGSLVGRDLADMIA